MLYDRAAQLNPLDGSTAYQAAQLVLASGNVEDAERRLRRVVSAFPDQTGAANDLAWILAERGVDLELALALAERATAAKPDANQLDTLGYVLLKRGEFGTGKTILATQFICNGILRYGEPGIIVLLEQNMAHYKKDLKPFKFDIDALQQSGKLIIIDASMSKMSTSGKLALAGDVRHLPSPSEKFMTTKEVVDYLLATAEQIGAKRIVVDNIPALDNLLRRTRSTRDEVIYMNYSLQAQDLTSVLISDTLKDRSDDIENYVTDGVIVLEYNVTGPDTGRHIYIKKMRGTEHSENIHTLRFKKGVGIEVLEE